MPPLVTFRPLRSVVCVGLVAVFGLGCRKKVTQEQCDQLLDHFAEVVVRERLPDAGAEAIASEQARERREATHDNEFKNCTSEVQSSEFDCAMKAPTSAAVIKCLE